MRKLFAAAMIAACAMAQSADAPPMLRGVHRVVCLGDSITQFAEQPGVGYVWLLRHTLANLYPDQAIETINAGISGNKSTDMIARYKTDVLDKKPDLVTISVGVNDVWHGFYDNHPLGDGPRGVPLADYRANVDKMVAEALASGAKVVILAATPIYEDLGNRENERQEAYNAALRDIARRRHVLYVDYQRPFRNLIRTYRRETGGRDNLLTTDGVHMNPEGYKVMTHTLLTALGVTPEAQAEVGPKVQREAAVPKK